MGHGKRSLTGVTAAGFLGTILVAVGLPVGLRIHSASAASPCGPPVTSVIGCENTLAGDPSSDWQEAGAGDSTLQGFATSMSVNVGQTVSFKVKSTASAYHIDILRLGYYQAAATVPGALTNMVATAGNGSATVNWTAPSNGGSAITSYTITPYVGTTARASTTISGSPPATSATITGLTNGSTYTFKVSATNAIGTGPQSAASNAVKACGLICL